MPEDLPGDTVLLSFIPAGFRYNTATESFFDYPEPIVHTNGTQTGTKTVLTMDDYRNMCGGGLTSDGFLKIELRISYYELDNRHLLSEVNSSTYRMVNFNPRVFYSGYGTLELDCIEIEDMLHRKMKENYDYFQDGLVSRVNTLSQSSDILTGVYTYDEPHQPQFDTFFLMQRMLGERPQRTMTAIADYRYREFQMQGSEYYDHIDAFIKLAKPKAVMPDPYPIRPSFLSDNQLDWNDPSNQNVFFQTVIDRRVTDAYRDVKKYTISPSINGKFYPIVQAFGRWKDNKWLTFMLPPSETQKMLQFLPLCYGADGIFDYRLFGWLNHPDYDEYAAINVQYPNGTSYVPPDSTTYRALLEANSKVLSYGPKTASMNWINSVTITETSYEPADVNLSSVWVDSIQDVDTNQTGPYGCYVECGMYTDTDSTPYLMLVNRRANHFAPNATYSYPGNVPVNQYDTCFPAFDSQRIGIIPDTMAYTQFGTYVAMFDSLGAQLHRKDGENIRVDIGPGDGILLQMCSSLPNSVTNDAVLKKIAYLSGEITIDGGADVSIEPNTLTTIFPNSVIRVKGGSSLNISGSVAVGDSVSIIVEEGSSISFAKANCSWGIDSVLEIDGAVVYADSSSFVSSVSAQTWAGIHVSNSGSLSFSNTTIAGAEENNVDNSSVNLLNCSITIPANGVGLDIENYETGLTVRIDSNQEGSGFFGSDGTAIGLKYWSLPSAALIRNMVFSGLLSGIENQYDSAIRDTIQSCHFIDTATGIHLTGSEFSPLITDCHFVENSIGIELEGASPKIEDCSFTQCDVGIRTEWSTSVLGGIYDCSFDLGDTGIVSRGSNLRLADNSFYTLIGILNHSGSTLNMSSSANNLFNSEVVNLDFQDTASYNAYIQLYAGHNDFYHENSGLFNPTFDFRFDTQWHVSPPPRSNAISASNNWFENGLVKVNAPGQASHYVTSFVLDPSPNVIIESEDRMATALISEKQGDSTTANSIYKAILDENLVEESQLMIDALDGCYRTSAMSPDSLLALETYILSKISQYETENPKLTKYLQDYLVKDYLLIKDYQSAINLLQVRLDNPESEIDSLLAVMDLEIVLHLAAMNETKQPITTKYTQYVYPSRSVFSSKHSEQWNLLRELYDREENDQAPIPLTAQISANYPNPFNPSTTIEFSIPQTGQVNLCIYNIRGQRVKNLQNSVMERGYHRVVWDGRDTNNCNVASGIYFIKLESGGKTSIRKAMLLK